MSSENELYKLDILQGNTIHTITSVQNPEKKTTCPNKLPVEKVAKLMFTRFADGILDHAKEYCQEINIYVNSYNGDIMDE